MRGSLVPLGCTVAILGFALAYPASAQRQLGATLEDRIRVLEQKNGIVPPPYATLEQRVEALEMRQAASEPRQTGLPLGANPPVPTTPVQPALPLVQPELARKADENIKAIANQEPRLATVEQKVADTTISGRMYFNTGHIDNSRDKLPQSTNGWGFDAKRFYVSVDHRFNDIFSADITTDFNYVSADGETQLYVKKAFLQADIDPALILRAGSADLPWIAFNEGVYGYRYLENVLEERDGFGTSADWGLHALGSTFGGIFNYQVSVVNGAGYKKLTRSKTPDVEARANINYMGITAAVGARTGHLGQDIQGGAQTFHSATRFDALLSYTAMDARVGVQYMNTSNWNQVTSAPSDSSDGYSLWGSYYFLPHWGIFGRYDWVNPSRNLHANMRDRYFNVGITYTPTRIVDFSLAYKRETLENGFWSTTNGIIGGLVNATGHSGTYDEVGLWSDFQW